MNLLHGNCLELMKDIKSGSVDAIICDPPYGTTACKWDSVIPFDLMWEQLNRIIKPNGAIVLFGSEPFSSALRMSNIKNYKYDWIWDRVSPSGFLNANLMPMKRHEIISVFVNKGKTTYNKQMEKRNPNANSLGKKENYSKGKGNANPKVYGSIKDKKIISYNEDLRNPTTIIEFSKGNNRHSFHPTQKPVELMEYLIKTYTNEKETVLDFTMGSGSTGVACKNLNRNFIGIEMDYKYFEIAQNRINSHNPQIELF
jgi:DNA modification methylase